MWRDQVSLNITMSKHYPAQFKADAVTLCGPGEA